ncbi:MAG: hypothetical protein Ct9H300mP1_22800 [Planctomycetaceae bacterium]|nr:MAG: hypothetical protein Ct9H300mP1_22800 [Planctomycetaceae bacterium]
MLTKGVITDAKLPDVWSLRRCTNLDLSGTEITDESVPLLVTLTQLKQLDIHRTQISEKGTETSKRHSRTVTSENSSNSFRSVPGVRPCADHASRHRFAISPER